jgi:hypothetical protein
MLIALKILNRMKISLFLGSGASVPYGKPTTKDFRSLLMKKYQSLTDYQSVYIYEIIKYEKFVDIEHVLQCTKDIQDFYKNLQYGAVYINSLKANYDVNNYGRQLNDLIANMKFISTTIESEVYNNYSWNHTNDKDLSNLDVFIRYILNHSTNVDIYTTNYDRAVEEYCSQNNDYLCSDGFEHINSIGRSMWKNRFDQNVKDVTNINLFKLHGSLNWKRHKQYGIERVGEESRANDPNYVENLVIYPYLSPKDGMTVEPYKSIRNNFIERSKEIDVLVVIGYSFRDQHVNEILKKMIEDNKQMIFISPTVNSDLKDNFYNNDDFHSTELKLQNGGSYYVINNRNNVTSIEYGISLENNETILRVIADIVDN